MPYATAGAHSIGLAKKLDINVDKFERFYARHLPLSREMAKSLRSICGNAPGGVSFSQTAARLCRTDETSALRLHAV